MIEKLRQEIDKIDDQIAKLYSDRMDVALEIGKVKMQDKKAVSVPEREKQIINRVTSLVDDDKKVFLKQIFEQMFFQSKALQSRLSLSSSKIAEEIRECTNKLERDLPPSATVACQGIAGAYSGIATEKLFEISDITYFKNFDAVFNAVDKGLCEYGVLPIENSTAGSVSQVYDLMTKHNFYIVKSIKLQITHSLVAKLDADITKIKKVISHEQALNQCAEFLKKMGVEVVAVENTAVAAKMVSEGDDLTVAAICSEESAKAYGLQVLEKGVQDNGNNFTRFICISKNMQIFKGADKISVVTSLESRPGSLNKMLSRFAAQGLNLTKIESRPIPNCTFEFLFYFDFEGATDNEGVINLIAALKDSSDKFKFLGCYKEII